MATYQNRLNSNCKTCHTSDKLKVKEPEVTKEEPVNNHTGSEIVTPAQPYVPEPQAPKGNDSLSTIECGKKILSITKVGEKVVVMYDNCSYSTAPLDVVAKESFAAEALGCLTNHVKTLVEAQKKLQEKVAALEAKPDNDTIYDDSALTARVEALENKPDNDTIYDDTQIKDELSQAVTRLSDAIAEAQAKFPDYVRKDDLIIVENLEGTQDLFKAYPLSK